MRITKLAVAVAAAGLVATGCGGEEASSGRSADGGGATTSSKPETVATDESPSTPAQDDAETFEVVKVGFAESGAGDLRFVNPVALIKNNGEEIASITVSFAAYDASGSVIGQSETSAPIVRAGATVATTTVIDLAGDVEVDSVDARVSVLQAQADDNPDSRFVPSDVNFRAGEFGSSVTGKIKSEYQQSVTSVYVAAVCYDEAGNITAGGETYVDIPSGQTVPVEVDVSAGENYRAAECELYPTLGGASSGEDG
jgi:hypothetical protein